MRVLTFDNDKFASECRRLAEDISKSGFTPEHIIGIRTGGEFVVWEMQPSFPESEITFVGVQRPSTPRKERVGKLLRLLPLKLLDFMRKVEACVLSLKRHKTIPAVDIRLDRETHLPNKILIVDDAVDSGTTLSAVVEAVGRVCPNADVRTAVITVTTSNPKIQPDFALYRNKTLIRFPWSIDMKTTKPER